MPKQKFTLATVLLLLAGLTWGVSGCGSQSQNAAPPTAAAAAPSETSTQAEATAALEPTVTPVVKPTQTPTALPTATPAPTATETLQTSPTDEMIDGPEMEYWGLLPSPDDVFNFSYDGNAGPEGALSATSFSDLATLLALYRRELSEQGWQEQADLAVIEANEATLLFEDHEVILRLELSQVEEGVTEINLTSATAEGAATTVDVKELPRPEDISGLQTQGTEFLRYDIETDLESVLEFYRRELTALGWQERTEFGYIEDHAILRFFGKGNFQISVLLLKLGAKEIGVDLQVRDLAAEAALAEATETARAAIPPLVAGESVVLTNYEVPLPDTAVEVEVEANSLSYTVTSEPRVVFDFYHEVLNSLNWRQIESGFNFDDSVSQSTYRYTNDEEAMLDLILSQDSTVEVTDGLSEIDVLVKVAGEAEATNNEDH